MIKQNDNSLNNTNNSLNSSLPEFSDVLSIPTNPEDLFTLLYPIGKGSLGTVYKAIHNTSKKIFAIKIIDYMKNVENNQINKSINFFSFAIETSLMKLVNNSNYILKYFGSYYSKNMNNLWLILEYCSSGSAVDLMLSMNRTFSEIEIATIMENILQALIIIHSMNIIHKNIKGENILLSKNGYAKLDDFGIKLLNDDNQKNKNDSDNILNSNYNTKSDIFFLGITCIELVEGQSPFSDLKSVFVMDKITNKTFDINEIINKNEHTEDFYDFVKNCLEIDQKKRKSAKELIKHNFIKKHAKGKEFLAKLVKKHVEDVENYRFRDDENLNIKEEEEKNEDNSKNSKNSKNNSKINNSSSNNNIYSMKESNKSESLLSNEDKIVDNIYSNNVFDSVELDYSRTIPTSNLQNKNGKKIIEENNKNNLLENDTIFSAVSSVHLNDDDSMLSVEIKDENKNKNEAGYEKYIKNNNFIYDEDKYIEKQIEQIKKNLIKKKELIHEKKRTTELRKSKIKISNFYIDINKNSSNNTPIKRNNPYFSDIYYTYNKKDSIISENQLKESSDGKENICDPDDEGTLNVVNYSITEKENCFSETKEEIQNICSDIYQYDERRSNYTTKKVNKINYNQLYPRYTEYKDSKNGNSHRIIYKMHQKYFS